MDAPPHPAEQIPTRTRAMRSGQEVRLGLSEEDIRVYNQLCAEGIAPARAAEWLKLLQMEITDAEYGEKIASDIESAGLRLSCPALALYLAETGGNENVEIQRLIHQTNEMLINTARATVETNRSEEANAKETD